MSSPREAPIAPQSTEAEEAEWEVATAETLRTRGDLAGAATWYRRAAEHLMDAGEDDRALELARLAADLATPSTAPIAAPIAAPHVVSSMQAPPVEVRRRLSYLPARATEGEQVAAQLPALPPFAELPVESLRALARQVTVVHFAAGDALVAGDAVGPMLVLTEGSALLHLGDDPDAPSHLGAGDVVGEVAAYYGGSGGEAAIAQTAVTAVAFAPSLVRALAQEYESFRVIIEDLARERAFAALPRRAPLLQALPPAVRAAAWARFEHVRLREGDALFGEGMAPGAVWLVAAGEVEVYGGELGPGRLVRAHAGDALGVGPVLAGEQCGVSARALGRALAARIGAEVFCELEHRFPQLRAGLDPAGLEMLGIVC